MVKKISGVYPNLLCNKIEIVSKELIKEENLFYKWILPVEVKCIDEFVKKNYII